MRLIRRSVLGAAAVVSVSALGAPMAQAQVPGWWGTGGSVAIIGQANGPIGCDASSPVGNGFAGGTTANSCYSAAAGVGPAVGVIANVTGPVTTGSLLLAPIVVAAGPTLGGS